MLPPRGEGEFALAIGFHGDVGEHVAAQHEERHEAQLRIAGGGAAPPGPGPAEGGVIKDNPGDSLHL